MRQQGVPVIVGKYLIILNLSHFDYSPNYADVFNLTTNQWSKDLHIVGGEIQNRKGYKACVTEKGENKVIIYGGRNPYELCDDYLVLVVKDEENSNKS